VLDVSLIERRDQVVAASLSQTQAQAPQARTDIILGLDVQDLTPSLADTFKLQESRGVLIAKVAPNSLAQAEGLHEGDLIKEVNRVEVRSVGEFNVEVSKIRPGETVLLRLLRETRAFYVVLKPTNP
jgi:serine protease Do